MPRKREVIQEEFTLSERLENFFENPILKKMIIMLVFVALAFITFGVLMSLSSIVGGKTIEPISVCSDNTFYDTCSFRKPYFCSSGNIVENASVCGCPDSLTKKENSCTSKYQTSPKDIILKYILRGEENEINYTVYRGVVDYLSGLSKSIYYSGEEQPLRADFKFMNINEEEQRELLLGLVVKIQNLAEDKEEQARIAISLVQNIPYGGSEKINEFKFSSMNYSRYPYEVLYDMQGVCEEKSELLVFLLREIGYSTVIFYYQLENHEAVGIKCPVEYGLGNTGYCFIETTGPSIISNNQNYYFELGRLSSEPEIILISDGLSLGENLYEYKDAKSLIKIGDTIEKKGKISFIKDKKLDYLREKYGLQIF